MRNTIRKKEFDARKLFVGDDVGMEFEKCSSLLLDQIQIIGSQTSACTYNIGVQHACRELLCQAFFVVVCSLM
jgi:hypothetical protein